MQRHIFRYDNTSVVSDTNITLRRNRQLTSRGDACGRRERASINRYLTRGSDACPRADGVSTFDSFAAARYEHLKLNDLLLVVDACQRLVSTS